MFGLPDNIYTSEQLTALITKWEAAAAQERKVALEERRNGELITAEGCFGGAAVYRQCIADLKKLRGF